ncbi:hypothetical protein L1887_04814 [Cichorium endivia]|nr:hypothetical protein L1887_04814 [Cichorium endivia]
MAGRLHYVASQIMGGNGVVGRLFMAFGGFQVFSQIVTALLIPDDLRCPISLELRSRDHLNRAGNASLPLSPIL